MSETEARISDTPQVLSSGSLAVDYLTGCGGYPRGSIIEIFGSPQSGKTTLALLAAAQAQRARLAAAFIDAEHALELEFARRAGVDVDALLYSQPRNGEEALEVCRLLAASNAVGVIIVDSVAALVPRLELEGDPGPRGMGWQHQLLEQELRRLSLTVAASDVRVIFTNQLRHRPPGGGNAGHFVSPGGNALKHYAALRLRLQRLEHITGEGGICGILAGCKVIKNRFAQPYLLAEIPFDFRSGIDRAHELLALSLRLELLTATEAGIFYGETQLGGNRADALAFLRSNPQLARALFVSIRDKQ